MWCVCRKVSEEDYSLDQQLFNEIYSSKRVPMALFLLCYGKTKSLPYIPSIFGMHVNLKKNKLNMLEL